MNETQEQQVVKQLFNKYNFKSDSPNSFRFQTSTDMSHFIRSCAKHLIDKNYPLEDYHDGTEDSPNLQATVVKR